MGEILANQFIHKNMSKFKKIISDHCIINSPFNDEWYDPRTHTHIHTPALSLSLSHSHTFTHTLIDTLSASLPTPALSHGNCCLATRSMLLVVNYFVHSHDAACERKAQKIHVRCSLMEDREKGRGPSWFRV